MVVGVPSSVAILEEEDDIHVCELPTSIQLPVNPNEIPVDQINTIVEYPFEYLSGEELIDQSVDSTDSYIYLTNYRLFIFSNQSSSHCSFINCPIRLIEFIEIKDNTYLSIQCKDIRSFRLMFFTTEKCCYWLRKLNEILTTINNFDDLFAIKYFLNYSKKLNYLFKRDYFHQELIRLKLDIHPWRITDINQDYKLSPSYPNLCVVPANITDEEVREVAKFRSYRRFPTIVWR